MTMCFFCNPDSLQAMMMCWVVELAGATLGEPRARLLYALCRAQVPKPARMACLPFG